MITLLLMILTWYFTKLFYTRSALIKLSKLEDDGRVKANCAKCARTVVTVEANLRTPFYCVTCK
jgi:hypothetical protein